MLLNLNALQEHALFAVLSRLPDIPLVLSSVVTQLQDSLACQRSEEAVLCESPSLAVIGQFPLFHGLSFPVAAAQGPSDLGLLTPKENAFEWIANNTSGVCNESLMSTDSLVGSVYCFQDSIGSQGITHPTAYLPTPSPSSGALSPTNSLDISGDSPAKSSPVLQVNHQGGKRRRGVSTAVPEFDKESHMGEAQSTEEDLHVASTAWRAKKRKTETGPATFHQPVEQPGRLEADRPQEIQYQEEEEPPRDEVLEQSSAQPLAAVEDFGPEGQCLSDKASYFVAAIASAGREVVKDTTSDVSRAVSHLFQSLQGHIPEGAEGEDDSLQNLALRCIQAEQSANCLDFVYMINCIQLRHKVVSTCNQTRQAPTTVLKSIESQTHRSYRTLARYVSDGAKYCLLAGGGSIFLLALVAIAKLKARVRDVNLTQDVRYINHLLRAPVPDTYLGQTIVADIIPAIATLRHRHRVLFPAIFSPAFLLSQGVLPFIEISDLKYSDEFFDRITFNALLIPRSRMAWESCYSPLDPDNKPESRAYLSDPNASTLRRETPSQKINRVLVMEVVHTKYNTEIHKTPLCSTLDDGRDHFTEGEGKPSRW